MERNSWSKILRANEQEGQTHPYEPDLLAESAVGTFPEAFASHGGEDGLLLIEREAYERGFAQGERAGLELGQQKAEALMEGIVRLLEEVSGLRHQILERGEEEMIRLALEIARKVVHQELAVNREAVVAIAKAAIRQATERQRLVVRIHPEDLAHMVERKPDFLRAADGIRQLTIQEDESLAPGDVVVETALGEVDARIETQLGVLGTELEREIEHQRELRIREQGAGGLT